MDELAALTKLLIDGHGADVPYYACDLRVQSSASFARSTTCDCPRRCGPRRDPVRSTKDRQHVVANRAVLSPLDRITAPNASAMRRVASRPRVASIPWTLNEKRR